jgi:hypothetical protein
MKYKLSKANIELSSQQVMVILRLKSIIQGKKTFTLGFMKCIKYLHVLEPELQKQQQTYKQTKEYIGLLLD